jgi:hypothetical protein
MVEDSTILASTPSRVIAVLAHQRACAAVRRQIKAKGLKLCNFTAAALRAQAREYLAEHQELIGEAVEMVRGCAELRKMYEREQRRYAIERNSTHSHKA